MRPFQISILLLGMLSGFSCSPRSTVDEPTSPQTEIPVATPPMPNTLAEPKTAPVAAISPIPTPHPAVGATQAVLRAYPELAKKDSMFNRAFRDLYEDRQKTDPASLTKPDWPLTLAKETTQMLSAVPSESPTAKSSAAPAKPNWFQERMNNPPSALEKGAYDQRRVMYPRNYYYYSDASGRFWIDINGTRHYY